MARPTPPTKITIHGEPVKRERVSSGQFLKLVNSRPENIQRSRFVPPALGEAGFGSFEVEYHIPVIRRTTA